MVVDLRESDDWLEQTRTEEEQEQIEERTEEHRKELEETEE